ncbi:MAG: hypothetical protein PHO41_08445, partial [Eubacteriales bacterium]|nr:hypothetical protein [Eubacteriales bacterium]
DSNAAYVSVITSKNSAWSADDIQSVTVASAENMTVREKSRNTLQGTFSVDYDTGSNRVSLYANQTFTQGYLLLNVKLTDNPRLARIALKVVPLNSSRVSAKLSQTSLLFNLATESADDKEVYIKGSYANMDFNNVQVMEYQKINGKWQDTDMEHVYAYCENGIITVYPNTDSNGTYTLHIYLNDYPSITKPLTLRVKLYTRKPKLTIQNKPMLNNTLSPLDEKVRLNLKYSDGSELSYSNIYFYYLDTYEGYTGQCYVFEDSSPFRRVEEADGLYLTFDPDNPPAAGTYTFYAISYSYGVSTCKFSVKVTGAPATLKATASGKIDPLDPDSEAKLKLVFRNANLPDGVDESCFALSNEHFQITGYNENTKTLVIRMVKAARDLLATDRLTDITFTSPASGNTLTTAKSVLIPVRASTPSAKVSPSVINLLSSVADDEQQVTLQVSKPKGGTIQSVTVLPNKKGVMPINTRRVSQGDNVFAVTANTDPGKYVVQLSVLFDGAANPVKLKLTVNILE